MNFLSRKLESLGYRLSVGEDSWASTRGAQLTVGYAVNTYSKPPLYYTLGAVAPRLACLRTPAVLRMAHALGPGGPLPHADLFIARTCRQTRLTTSQSDSTQL